MERINHVAIYCLCLSLGIQGLYADPIITSVSPNNGVAIGGNVVTISGSGFTSATDVDFGFRPSTIFTVLNDNSITAEVLVGNAGTFDVTVTAASIT